MNNKKIHAFLFALSAAAFGCDAFTVVGTNSRLLVPVHVPVHVKQSSTTSISAVRFDNHDHNHNHMNAKKNKNKVIDTGTGTGMHSCFSIASLSLATMISLSTMTTTLPAQAYEDYDDVDTVETTIQALKDASGSVDASFKVFESINEIITEGKGVGGSLSAKGVNLERGFVADEDTTIYNPGLSLLTESEKNRIVDAVIENRKNNVATKTWSKNNEYAYDSIKTRMDPLHMVELKGYLGVLPFYGAAVYLAALAVQQIARDFFSTAYIISAGAIFLPILLLVLKGP
uniref:Uncharacterized protein n=1 Tax=Chaetoceros debilis TaxID=122233 RepID=A0A7S3V7P7_9STRA|mmetsp:Transcript_23012/g.35061  ORF Transcript_23012/g.35061 Transcript_23012/m.35061 type:complete len:287 (-) Transcript_23012:68-928(-)|eukprot:CAMPEP_0194109558 /NCGR_PEP_ID=MMETSP0150-20130528/9027_1 /TAXON_ID=122233 /ORGANISM="Chaetoceros debilis, Strain MM31A-1" /LENGTH=286 /DNA_ID=CAMNT_0038798543 /DNA_START=98 /DNA_END=958 /DNA_ORIENTATION=+